MIRIRCLPASALASLLVKTAEEQRTARKVSQHTYEIIADPHILYIANGQKEGRPR